MGGGDGSEIGSVMEGKKSRTSTDDTPDFRDGE